MNMILHGIEAPNVIHANTLADNISDIQDRDRFDVILANPPFGGKERKEVQQNFPIKTGETAFLFLQHFIKTLRAGGRAAIVIKNTFLSNTDNASTSIRKLLLESCNLHTVLDMPGGTFQGAGVKTVVLFFEKGAPTRKVWFYQLNPGRNMGKTNPLNDDDLVDFIARQKTFADSAQSWSVDVAGIDTATYDLSVKNPNGGDEVALRTPQEILDEIAALDAESAEVLAMIRGLGGVIAGWESKPIGEVCTIKPPKAEARAKLADGDEVSFAPMEDLGIGVKYLKPHRTRQLAEVSGSYTYFADGDVLLAKITPCFENGKLGVARGLTNGVGFGSSEYIVLRPAATLDAEFLYYYLSRPTFLEEGARIMTGAVGHKRVTKEFVESYPIPLPPLREQRRIVAILDEAFEGIATAKANAEKNLQNAREVFRIRLRSIFDAVNGLPLPEGWYETQIKELGIVQSGAGFPLAAQGLVDGGIPFYKVSDMNIPGNEREMLYENNSITEAARRTLGASLFPSGSVIFPKIGGAIATNKKRIATRDCCVDNNVMGVVPRVGRVNPEFLFYFFLGHDLSEFANEAHLPSIRKTVVEDWKVSVPRSLDEQRRIASELEVLEDQVQLLERVYVAKLTALDDLKKSLLHQAFAGALTAKSADKQVAEVA